jgi:hypothetical protein
MGAGGDRLDQKFPLGLLCAQSTLVRPWIQRISITDQIYSANGAGSGLEIIRFTGHAQEIVTGK